MTAEKKPCTRCLLDAAGNADMSELIKERIAALPSEERAEVFEYRRRLEVCLKCEALSKGVCVKCGCFVELRAARRSNRCPAAADKWQQL